MREMRLARWLERCFGAPADRIYYEGDMARIRAYSIRHHKKNPDAFWVDDITWNDLSMDDVFQQLNAAQSTSGEQYLYHMLRYPATDEAEYGRRSEMLALMEKNPGLRLQLQLILARLGKRRAAYAHEASEPSKQTHVRLGLTLALSLGLIGSLIAMPLWPPLALLLIALVPVNAIYHTLMAQRLEWRLASAQYSVDMSSACQRIRKLGDAKLDAMLGGFYEAGQQTRGLLRMGGVSLIAQNDLSTLFNSLLLFDLLLYARLEHMLWKHSRDIAVLHENLGRLDTAIATASYRKSRGKQPLCDPDIDFSPEAPRALAMRGLAHPLLKHPVANSFELRRSLLLTGSNASGKSTFLKAAALNALLAQSLCTALCGRYRGTAFHLYSSMAMSDDVQAGESYFIAEIKSLRRILQATEREEPVLCVIDEVLRGTNTVERISASSELLLALSEHALCMAATHDGELCGMLANAYDQGHFEESVRGRKVHFDYKFREGPATTRNAIKLLSVMGYSADLVTRATARAERYMQTGKWEFVTPHDP